jgi:hypothetical protein
MLEFQYVSTSGTAVGSTNTALGQVGMYIQYDTTAPLPSTLKEALNYAGVRAECPSKNFVMKYDGRNLPIRRFYCSNNGTSTGTNNRFSSPGNLIVFTYGAQNTNIAGNLNIRYRIKMIKKTLSSTVGSQQNQAGYYYNLIQSDTFAFSSSYQALTGNYGTGEQAAAVQ